MLGSFFTIKEKILSFCKTSNIHFLNSADSLTSKHDKILFQTSEEGPVQILEHLTLAHVAVMRSSLLHAKLPLTC